ncbi:MAG TPA: hypothetical protein VF029_06910 [Actinomycetota bacterium]
MTRRWRTVARAAAVGALAVLLSACLKLDMDLSVNADDTVSGTVVFALDKQLLELTGQSAEDLLGTDAPVPTDAEGVSTERYEDDRFQGQRYSFESVSLARFNEGGDPDALQIVRDGDAFRVTGVLDLSEATGGTGVTGFPDLEGAFEGAELRIRMTFPGEVTESNGTVDGNTVTWEPRIGERTEIRATGSAIEGAGGGSNLAIILAIVGVVVVLAIVVAILAHRRRGASPAGPGELAGPEAASPISSSAPPSGAVTPPAPGREAVPPATPTGDMTPPSTPPLGDAAPPAPPPTEEPTPRPVEERPPAPPTPPHGEQEEPPPGPPA